MYPDIVNMITVLIAFDENCTLFQENPKQGEFLIDLVQILGNTSFFINLLLYLLGS